MSVFTVRRRTSWIKSVLMLGIMSSRVENKVVGIIYPIMIKSMRSVSVGHAKKNLS